jgi:small-conductance mechanosensitive channel
MPADAPTTPSLNESIARFSDQAQALWAWFNTNWAELVIWTAWFGVAAIAGAATFIALTFLRNRVAKLLRGDGLSTRAWRLIAASVVDNTWRLFFAVIAASVAAAILGLNARWVQSAMAAAFFLQAGLWAAAFLIRSVDSYAERQGAERSALASAISLVHFLINMAIWSVVTLVLLSNLGIDVTGLVAGLGIGGVAVGLAAQGIIADLFASLSIVLDRPFVRGDFVVFGEHMGTVESVGVKSTRVRSLSGEQIVISNANMLAATIRNYQHLYERRVVFSLMVSFDAAIGALETLPAQIQAIIGAYPDTRFERCHLKNLGEIAAEYETVYHMLSADYGRYMDVQEKINLDILRLFKAKGIDFAFEARSLAMAQGERLRGALRSAI